MRQEKMTVVQQTEIAQQVYELVLTGDLVSEMQTPGQFLHLLVPRNDLLLRRPISIASIDHRAQQCTLLYRVVGEGTKALALLQAKDQIDVLGPNGNGFPLTAANRGDVAYLIGGGIGVPPLYELAKQLHEKGVQVTSILGFRTKEDSFYVDAFKQWGKVYVATEDGSLGQAGHVGQYMETLATPDVVYACGPNAMLKAVDSQYADLANVYLSLEERMACGIGACYGCVCESNDGTLYKVCQDGPVFKGGLIKL